MEQIKVECWFQVKVMASGSSMGFQFAFNIGFCMAFVTAFLVLFVIKVASILIIIY